MKFNSQEWSDEDVIRVTGITSLSHKQMGLMPLSTYDVRILSINYYGPSNFSQPGTFSTVGKKNISMSHSAIFYLSLASYPGKISIYEGRIVLSNTLVIAPGETVALNCSLEQVDSDSHSVTFLWRRWNNTLPLRSYQNGSKVLFHV